jgi:hypothetical protein
MPDKAKKRARTPTSMQQPLQQTTASNRCTTEPPKETKKEKKHVESDKKKKPAPKNKTKTFKTPRTTTHGVEQQKSVLRGG